MAGAKSEIRLARKERLEILIGSLRQVLRQRQFCVRVRFCPRAVLAGWEQIGGSGAQGRSGAGVLRPVCAS